MQRFIGLSILSPARARSGAPIYDSRRHGEAVSVHAHIDHSTGGRKLDPLGSVPQLAECEPGISHLSRESPLAERGENEVGVCLLRRRAARPCLLILPVVVDAADGRAGNLAERL